MDSSSAPVWIAGGGIGGLAQMSAKSSEDYYGDLAWLYGETG
jgi:hypothetical protein